MTRLAFETALVNNLHDSDAPLSVFLPKRSNGISVKTPQPSLVAYVEAQMSTNGRDCIAFVWNNSRVSRSMVPNIGNLLHTEHVSPSCGGLRKNAFDLSADQPQLFRSSGFKPTLLSRNLLSSGAEISLGSLGQASGTDL
jgi:hypothetical protein